MLAINTLYAYFRCNFQFLIIGFNCLISDLRLYISIFGIFLCYCNLRQNFYELFIK